MTLLQTVVAIYCSPFRSLFVHHIAIPHTKYGKAVTAQAMKAHGQLEVKLPSSLSSALYRGKLSHSSPDSFKSTAIGCLRGPQSSNSYLVLLKKSVVSTVIPRS